MAEIKWIKITTDIFDDEKILMIEQMPNADATLVIWLKLLCLAGKQNNSGVFLFNDRIAYTDQMLAAIFRRSESITRYALQTFEQLGMIEVVDGVITIPNWGKHQNLDRLEEKKNYMRGYMQKYRQKQKALVESKGCKTNSKTNSKANVSQTEEIEEDIERDKDIEGKALSKDKLSDNNISTSLDKKRGRFKPPTLEEVTAYCKERNNNIDPQAFIDFYQSKGWKVGNSPMKDWKACVRTWERRHQTEKPSLPVYEDDPQALADLEVILS